MYSGFLWRKGNNNLDMPISNQKWVRRWFCLKTDHCLYYYKNDQVSDTRHKLLCIVLNFERNLDFFFGTGIKSGWCCIINKSFDWELFIRHWAIICFPNYLERRHFNLFSSRNWRGCKSLDCRHEPCIETKWSMAWCEHPQFKIAAKQCTTSRLFRFSTVAREQMESLVSTLLCTQRCLPLLLSGWKQQKRTG